MAKSIARRIDGLDWDRIGAELDADGYALTGPLLTAAECYRLRALYPEDSLFR